MNTLTYEFTKYYIYINLQNVPVDVVVKLLRIPVFLPLYINVLSMLRVQLPHVQALLCNVYCV